MALDSPDPSTLRSDKYTLESGGHRAHMLTRTASQQAAFLLPYLKSGMRLLDAGCGAGSITVGLADAVAPGEAVGVDLEPKQVGLASGAALASRHANVRFLVASVYELPFPDQSFDVVFSNAVIEHMKEPVRALREIARVLKSGGLAGIRNGDGTGQLLAPKDTVLLQTLNDHRVRRLHGFDPEMGAQVKPLLREAGFQVLEMGASYECYSTPEAVSHWAQTCASVMREGSWADEMVRQQWADRPTLESWARAWEVWAENPDAFHARAYVYAVARKL